MTEVLSEQKGIAGTPLYNFTTCPDAVVPVVSPSPITEFLASSSRLLPLPWPFFYDHKAGRGRLGSHMGL